MISTGPYMCVCVCTCMYICMYVIQKIITQKNIISMFKKKME